MKTSVAFVAFFATAIAGLVLCGQPVNAQDTPVFTEYRGVKVGMAMADVRTKLGDPKEKYDTEDDFEFSENETARVVYGEDKKVQTLSIMFTGDLASAPLAKKILGEDVPARDDGSIYKMIQYPKQGFWVSYVKTTGAAPMVIVTMQRIPSE